MAEAKSVPVLFVTDTIVLPGMVVPIALDDAARAAIDANVPNSSMIIAVLTAVLRKTSSVRRIEVRSGTARGDCKDCVTSSERPSSD